MTKSKSIWTWRRLNAVISAMSEDDLKAHLNYEISTERRGAIMLRMHQRYEALRSTREREAIARGELL